MKDEFDEEILSQNFQSVVEQGSDEINATQLSWSILDIFKPEKKKNTQE